MSAATAEPEAGATMLLTIVLKHDQSKTLAEIGDDLDRSGFWAAMPPDGVSVESWYVMMGLGQVVTLRLPADKLQAVNLVIEKMAWKAFRTEFYPTYDYRAIADAKRADALCDRKG
jgi:hypothetical protein